MIILTKSLKDVKKAFVSITKVFLAILLGLIICTCSGQKLMLATRNSEKPIESFSYFGKPVNLIPDPMECAISRIEDRDFLLWPHQNSYTRQQYLVIHGTGYYQRLEQMRRKCLQTKWYQYPLITHSFLNRYRTVWIVPKRNLHIVYPRRSSQGVRSTRMNVPRNSLGSIPRSTGRIPVTTHTTGRNSNSSHTMNRASGRGQITSSTTGGSRRQR